MAGSAEGEGAHWPAFVDVLTAVIMVVVFLMVILSGAVMMLSKRVVEQVRAEMLARKDRDTTEAAAAKQGTQSARSPEADPGTSIAELGAVLRQEEPIDGRERLTVRTRATPETGRIAVKSLETPEPTPGAIVTTADVLIEVDFEPTAIKYGEAERERILQLLQTKAPADADYEIWSTAPQIASVSEAQRLAFYRAVLTRNLLIQAGITPSRIATQVRVLDPAELDHKVRVVLKP